MTQEITPRISNPLLPAKTPVKITPVMLDCFIELMEHGYGSTIAARELNLSYRQLLEHKKKNPEFHKRWEDARECLIDELEDALIHRCLKGTRRPIVQKGERVYERNPVTGELIMDESGNPIPVEEHVYPDGIAMSVLKANKRLVYGDKVQHDVTVTHGVLRVPETPKSVDAWETNLAIDVKAEPVPSDDSEPA